MVTYQNTLKKTSFNKQSGSQSNETCRKLLFSTKMHKIPRIDTMAKMMTGCNGASANGNMALYGLR